MRGHCRHHGGDERQPEEPVVGEVLDDRPREHDAGATAHAEQRRDEADPARHAAGRELVADDPEGEREDRAAGALDHTTQDEQAHRMSERGHQRAAREDQEHEQQRALLAEHVAEAASDRRGHRRAEQERREHPCDRRGAGVEVALDDGQRRGHERLQQRVGDPREREDREGEAVVLALRSGHRALRVGLRPCVTIRFTMRSASRSLTVPVDSSSIAASMRLRMASAAHSGGTLRVISPRR